MTKVRDQQASATKDGPPAATDPVSRLMERVSGLIRRPSAVDVPAQTTSRAKGAGSAPAPTARPRSDMSRFFIAMMAYVIGSFVLQYLLLLANSTFKLNLEKTQNLFPTSWPLIGPMSKFALIYLLLLVAFIWILYRTGVMPKDMFGARAAAERRAAQSAARSSGQSRSARRRTTAASTTAAAHTTSKRRVATPARASAATTSASSTYDTEYHRVKTLQRSRRRKR
jgi:hypothetical protein